MTQNLTRRSIVAGLGAAIPTAALAGNVSSSLPRQDAELLALVAEYERIGAAVAATDERCSELDEQHSPHLATMPDAVRWQAKDDRLFFWIRASERADGLRHYRRNDLYKFECLVARTNPDATSAAGFERAEEILAGLHQWEADQAAFEERLGIKALKDEFRELLGRSRELCSRIMATPATSLPGLVAKANVAADLHGGIDDDDLEPDSVGMALALVRDLLSFQPQSA